MPTEQQPEGIDPTLPSDPMPALGDQGAARRRFAKAAGLGASGVLMTLASQPGMACSICRGPSGHLSGTLKSPHGTPPTCAGWSPSDWCKASSWPCAKNTKFGSIFDCKNGGLNASKYAECPLLTLLNSSSTTISYKNSKNQTVTFSDTNGIGKYMAAAYLNAASRRSAFWTSADVVRVWNEYAHSGGGYVGHYQVTATVSWNNSQIVSYLKGTMD